MSFCVNCRESTHKEQDCPHPLIAWEGDLVRHEEMRFVYKIIKPFNVQSGDDTEYCVKLRYGYEIIKRARDRNASP